MQVEDLGSDATGSESAGDAEKIAEDIGYPIAVKAAGGGGGKGFRVALEPDKLEDAFGWFERLHHAQPWAVLVWTPALTAGIVWVSIFTQTGWLNSILEGLGIIDRPITWQSAETPLLLIMCVVIAEAWRATSIIMIILVAGLQSIPEEIHEAARVDGASYLQLFRKIVLPAALPAPSAVPARVTAPWNLGTGASQAIMAIAGAGLWLAMTGVDRSKALLLPLAFTIALALGLDLIFANHPKPGHVAGLLLGYLMASLGRKTE